MKKTYICCMKKNLTFLVVSIAIASIALISCTREYPTEVCESPYTVLCGFDSAAINVRVINESGYPLCDVALKYELGDQIVQYGRMDVGDISCYSMYDDPKFFPHLTFTLGTSTYAIRDTLKSDTLPYNNMKIEDPGFYTFFISISDSLTSGKCQTRIFKE